MARQSRASAALERDRNCDWLKSRLFCDFMWDVPCVHRLAAGAAPCLPVLGTRCRASRSVGCSPPPLSLVPAADHTAAHFGAPELWPHHSAHSAIPEGSNNLVPSRGWIPRSLGYHSSKQRKKSAMARARPWCLRREARQGPGAVL